MGLFRSLFRFFMPGRSEHVEHSVDPAAFLRRLKESRPNRLTIERVAAADERQRYRFSFTSEEFEGGTWRCERYVIMFDAEFVPSTFRRFNDDATWDDDGTARESAWFDRRGTVRNPHKKLAR